MKKNESLLSSFKNAFSGLIFLFKYEKNAKIHLAITLLVIFAGIFLDLSRDDWIWICLAIALVWGTELINTSLEKLYDLIQPETHPLVKVGKDTSAAAVLIMALLSILIGLLVLGPPLIHKLFN